MPGFGLSSWGGTGPVSDPGTFGELPATYAVAVGTNTIRVYLSAEPLYVSDAAPGDARNPLTWTVDNIATGFSFTITRIDEINPTTLDVHVLESLASRFVLHEIYATGLQLLAGGLFAPQPDFFLPGVSPARRPAPQRTPISDLANPQVPDPTGKAGTLIITSAGDYRNVSGAELVRKLIFRRLTTVLGGFFHLPGYGLAPSVKGLYPTSDLRRLKAEIERQIQQEPEVSGCSASIELGADNIMTIKVQAKLRPTNETITVSMKADSQTGQVVL